MKLNFKFLFNQPVFTDAFDWIQLQADKYWWVNAIALICWVGCFIGLNIFFIMWLYWRTYTDIFWFDLPMRDFNFFLVWCSFIRNDVLITTIVFNKL